jgi:hypothetical protein
MSGTSLPSKKTQNAASAEAIAKALGGRKVGREWKARCPAHNDRKPSLSIRDGNDGKVLVRCRSGCTQESVITALRNRGLWTGKGSKRLKGTASVDTTSSQDRADDAKRSKSATKIWQSTQPAKGTVVETYLAARGLQLPLPPTIRFHAGLKHTSGTIWPVMVSLVTHGVNDTPQAIHRAFLACDGSGKAPVDPQKMMLGPCRGGAIRLAPAGDVLLVGEGIETCLAAMQASSLPAWAALSTSGLKTLDLPQSVRDVIVLADGDEAGKAAARGAALRWKREGRRVRIAYPSEGMDFNDMLLGRAPKIQEGLQ